MNTTLLPELGEEAQKLLVELLERERIELPKEIRHTSTTAYKDRLRKRLDLVEQTLVKLQRA